MKSDRVFRRRGPFLFFDPIPQKYKRGGGYLFQTLFDTVWRITQLTIAVNASAQR